jgi:hypothetical protein
MWIGIVTVAVILVGGVIMFRNGHYGATKHTITSSNTKK